MLYQLIPISKVQLVHQRINAIRYKHLNLAVIFYCRYQIQPK